jgi:putative DNA methylase
MGSFIESARFPVELVNEASIREKRGGGRPPHWEMVFSSTRRLLARARALLPAALPENTDVGAFLRQVLRARIDTRENVMNVPHRENPQPPPEFREKFSRVRILAPLVGSGSIPLEAIRLGFGGMVAVEQGLGQKLVEDVRRWGELVAQRLAENPKIKGLHEPGVAILAVLAALALIFGVWSLPVGLGISLAGLLLAPISGARKVPPPLDPGG